MIKSVELLFSPQQNVRFQDWLIKWFCNINTCRLKFCFFPLHSQSCLSFPPLLIEYLSCYSIKNQLQSNKRQFLSFLRWSNKTLFHDSLFSYWSYFLLSCKYVLLFYVNGASPFSEFKLLILFTFSLWNTYSIKYRRKKNILRITNNKCFMHK